MTDPIDRIAAALERMSPPPPPMPDLTAHSAYVWRAGALRPARAFEPLPLDRLIGIDAQKAAMIENARRLANGRASHDVLAWGARGTGKSALVKSVVAAVQAEGGDVALVEAVDLATLPDLFGLLAAVPRAFALFVDDLGFESVADARVLRSMLEGGAEARPENVRLMVTANRRHLVARDMAEEAAAVSPRDAADDQLALADRFGLSLGFHVLDQDAYLAIVASHAGMAGLTFDADDAIRWAARRGSRSGRVAAQYATDLAGRAARDTAP